MRATASLLLAIVFWAQSVDAEEPVPAAFRVAIEVTVSDKELKKRLGMYLRNELRGLGDVEVTSDNPDFKIFAMVSEVRSSAGGRVAYVLGISITSFFPDGYFDSILSERLRNGAEVAQNLEEVTVYRNQFLSVSGPTEADLIETAVNSIAKIDSHILAPERQ